MNLKVMKAWVVLGVFWTVMGIARDGWSGTTYITVNSLEDTTTDASACTLRRAIEAYNTFSEVGGCSATSTDSIVINLPPGSIVLDAGPIQIHLNRNLSIIGNNSYSIIDGSNLSKIFNITGSSNSLSFSNLILQNGNNPDSLVRIGTGGSGGGGAGGSGGGSGLNCGGIVCDGAGAIADLRGDGNLNLDHVYFYNNRASNTLGGAVLKVGGASNISNSTFEGNSSSSGGGLALFDANATITNTTFSGNSVATVISGEHSVSAGGALALITTRDSPMNVNISASTIISNTAGNFAGGIYAGGNYLSLSVTNTILGLNTAPTSPNWYCVSSTLTATNNLLGSIDGCTIPGSTFMEGVDGLSNQLLTGTALSDFGLLPLAHNPPLPQLPTVALLPTSPAINNAKLSICSATAPTDERDVLRTTDELCDIGAYEYDPTQLGSGGASGSGGSSGAGGAGGAAGAGGASGSGGDIGGPDGTTGGISGSGGTGVNLEEGPGANSSSGGCSCHVTPDFASTE